MLNLFSHLDTNSMKRESGSSERGDFKSDNCETENPIPLPPKDNKPSLTSKPRHTRKHPLIIPPSSLQRTLDKFSVPSPPTATIDPFQTTMEPVYANHGSSSREFDTESLHFEAQIDSNLAALDEISQEQDCVDGSADFNCVVPDDKVQRHHVSCEDLLEFANVKPNSRTRGNDSDEVRIMSKVLGKDFATEQCLQILDFSEWDVLRAIKLAKLQKVVVGADLNICNAALEANSWDVTKAAQWILQQDEIMQV